MDHVASCDVTVFVTPQSADMKRKSLIKLVQNQGNTQYLNITVKTPSGKSMVTGTHPAAQCKFDKIEASHRQHTRVRTGPLTQRK